MFNGYPLRKYDWKDWLFMIVTTSLFMQIVVTVVLSNLLILEIGPFAGVTLTEENFLSITYQGTVFGTILSLPLTLLVVYVRKIPLFNRKGLTRKESFIIRGLSKDDWLFLLKYIPISYFIYTMGSGLLTMYFGPSEPINQIAVESLFDFIPEYLMFIMIVIVAPIGEELFFRGVLLFPGDKIDTSWVRVIISATLFGIVHAPTDVVSFYTYVGMGFIFAYASKRTQSIEAAIVYHFLNNLLGFVAIMAYR